MCKELFDREIDIMVNVLMYNDFNKDFTTSYHAMISETVKEKKAWISLESENESDVMVAQNKPSTRSEALHSIKTIRNYLRIVYGYCSKCIIQYGKNIIGSTSRDTQNLIHPYFM